MVESEGWTVLMELIEMRLRHEQKLLMTASARPDDAQGSYERVIGEWNGMRQVPKLAEGMVRYGEQASQEIESGNAAEAATS
jgi:hypothetical protein